MTEVESIELIATEDKHSNNSQHLSSNESLSYVSHRDAGYVTNKFRATTAEKRKLPSPNSSPDKSTRRSTASLNVVDSSHSPETRRTRKRRRRRRQSISWSRRVLTFDAPPVSPDHPTIRHEPCLREDQPLETVKGNEAMTESILSSLSSSLGKAQKKDSIRKVRKPNPNSLPPLVLPATDNGKFHQQITPTNRFVNDGRPHGRKKNTPKPGTIEDDNHNSTPTNYSSPELPNCDPTKIWPPRLRLLPDVIRKALDWRPIKPHDKPPFRFEMTMEAAVHNLRILESVDLDFGLLFNNGTLINTPLQPGSEFKPTDVLEPVFLHHPLWPRVRRTLQDGYTMPVDDLEDVRRVEDVIAAIRYGNHKSAMKNPRILWDMLKEEVEKGWQLVIPCRAVPQIPKTVVAPLGLVSQNTIDEQGNSTTKWRMTHDQSFSFVSETSINSRTQTEKLVDCLFGKALRRFAHAIIYYRKKFPTTPLLMTKFDLKSAYRRLHFSAISSLQSIATTVGIDENPSTEEALALVSLRMTFGGASNPSEFSTVTEMITDLANTLIQHRDWEPSTLFSAYNKLVGNEPKLLEPLIPFAEARELLIDLELSDFGANEAYIDDIFGVFPFLSDDHFNRGRNAVLTAIDMIGRPVTEGDPFPRDPLIAVKKVQAEGTPSETAVVLGWSINTRALTISLPKEKADSWDRELQAVIDRGDAGVPIDLATLESIQGRNVNIAMVVPGAYHFHSRIYQAIRRARKSRRTRLTSDERQDLRLARRLLKIAVEGVSLNTMVHRTPDHIGRSDAYEKGLGGFDLKSGRAWRLPIPDDVIHRKSQNFLEFLACLIQLLCLLQESDWSPGDCFLSIGDNTNALGWIQKSNFKPDDPDQSTHLALARHVTELLAQCKVTQYGQWFPGKDNGVADALSRQNDLSDQLLTEFVFQNFPTQTPPGFRIRPLAPGITSWALFWLRHTHETTELPPQPLTRTQCGGDDGSSSCTRVNSTKTSSSETSPSTSGTSSSARSYNEPETTNGPDLPRDTITWLKEHAVPPSRLLVRPLSQMVSTIPARTRMERMRSFYNVNSRGSKIWTQRKNHKKRSRSGSSRS